MRLHSSRRWKRRDHTYGGDPAQCELTFGREAEGEETKVEDLHKVEDRLQFLISPPNTHEYDGQFR